jgi:Domain of unknown function (DUF4821)
MHEQSDVLRDTFGDFFLADMIDAQDDQNRCAHIVFLHHTIYKLLMNPVELARDMHYLVVISNLHHSAVAILTLHVLQHYNIRTER